LTRQDRAVESWRLALVHTATWGKIGFWAIGRDRGVPRRGQAGTGRAVIALQAFATALMLAELRSINSLGFMDVCV